MKFELNQAIIDDIAFAMENQAGEAFFDCEELQVIYHDEVSEVSYGNDRYVSLPDWTSQDGFTLMADFVDTVRNPLAREELRRVLHAGRGVFRQFKDTIRTYVEVEKNWYLFKSREVERRIREWYNEQREFWGLEPLPIELDEEPDTQDLVISDFEFSVGLESDSEIIKHWDRKLFDETFPGIQPDERELWYTLTRMGFPLPAEGQDSCVLVARTPARELAGFIWALEAGIPRLTGTVRMARIVQLGVEKEFRGLGIAKALIRAYRAHAESRGVQRIVVDVPGSAEFMSKNLQREGFSQQATSWELEV